MNFLARSNEALTAFIFQTYETEPNKIRAGYGILAGGVSIGVISILFLVRIILGYMSGSISVITDAFHLLTHLSTAVVVIVSFWIASRPATETTPFGHGRMEYVASLIMAVILFFSGLHLGERAIHQIHSPVVLNYFPSLPWILAATIPVKAWMLQYVVYLGKKSQSHAIESIAFHHRIDTAVTFLVALGLAASYFLNNPQIDGYSGIAGCAGLFYVSFIHGREAVIPILGKAPKMEMLKAIRETAKSVDGVSDVHEIIVHDYGTVYAISLHAEIDEKLGPAQMHEIAEKCEWALRKKFGGEVICHTDPLQERTPYLQAIEDRFSELIREMPVTGYHDFRILSHSKDKVILVADIDVDKSVPESDYKKITADLNERMKQELPQIAYCTFYITPKFAY
jgi:cation diffusion facilitator family transporter